MGKLLSFPTFVEAWADGDDNTVSISKSPVMMDTDEEIEEVYRYIYQWCHSEMGTETVENEMMMFGEADITTYQLYEACPGEAIDHVCVAEQEGARWLHTGQSAS
ncbi:hypothetical protein [Actinopolyspora erythraea]|uniref:hypothetical protein n=1 Tax=Actinopolyspora erythraea TaxID=414996 RepID=UPI0012FD8193|nr:hypothetical protein [Actinopolyspora erythraea]